MAHVITKENLFDEILAGYYLPKVVDAYKAQASEKAEAAPGRHENHELPSLLMFYDGKTVLDRVKARFTTSPESSLRGESKVADSGDLQRILESETDQDHVYTYNSQDGILTRIKTSLNNTYEEKGLLGRRKKGDVNKLLQTMLPQDYVSSDYNSQPVINAGNRTRAAVVTVASPEVNPGKTDRVRAIMISQTVYNSGKGKSLTGKVSEVSKGGLSREVFFYQDPEHKGPFVDSSTHLVGVYRMYEPSKQGPSRKKEYFIAQGQDGMNLVESKAVAPRSPQQTSGESTMLSYVA